MKSPSSREMDQLIGTSDRENRKRTRRFCCSCIVVMALVITLFALVVVLAVGLSFIEAKLPSDPEERALALLEDYPVIDG